MITMRAFALDQTAARAEKMAAEVQRTVGSPDVEAVHDLRVSIRRFSQCLRTFRQWLPRGDRRRIRKRLKAVMDACSEVRDRDIALELTRGDGLPEDAALYRRLQADRTSAAVALQALLGRECASNLSGAARALLNHALPPPQEGKWDDEATAVENARRRLPPAAEKFFAAGRETLQHDDPEMLHQFRLRGKRFRYTLEIFSPLYGPGLERRLKLMRKIQGYLGDVNDLAAAEKLIEALPDAVAADAVHLRPRLTQRARKLTDEFRQFWRDTLDAEGEETRWRRYLARPSAGRSAKKVKSIATRRG